jgi:hypothetical protein
MSENASFVWFVAIVSIAIALIMIGGEPNDKEQPARCPCCIEGGSDE